MINLIDKIEIRWMHSECFATKGEEYFPFTIHRKTLVMHPTSTLYGCLKFGKSEKYLGMA
ncbi:MAG: hypothetical protein KIT56_11455 [Gammaproteobacteria bacterium]|nr:hypothetical protein [Gammaproteobacteria bacterium]MCW5584462.1 hypothetical protein [Gammaproteobacteria bacterium]